MIQVELEVNEKNPAVLRFRILTPQRTKEGEIEDLASSSSSSHGACPTSSASEWDKWLRSLACQPLLRKGGAGARGYSVTFVIAFTVLGPFKAVKFDQIQMR